MVRERRSALYPIRVRVHFSSPHNSVPGCSLHIGRKQPFHNHALLTLILSPHRSRYVQVAMNSAFVGVVIYIIYNFITTIQSDVTIRAEDALRRELQIIENCNKDYIDNKCHLPHGRLLELPCQELLACRNKPPPRIERYVCSIAFCFLRRLFGFASADRTWNANTRVFFLPTRCDIGRRWRHRHLR